MIGIDRAFIQAISAFVAAQILCGEPVHAQAAKADSPAPSQNRSLDQLEAAKAEPRSPAPATPPHLSLCGTILYADGRQANALLRLEGSGKIVSVGIGGDVLGWTAVQITETQLVLSLEDRSVTFTLNCALDQSEHPAVAQRQHPVTAQKKDERPITVHLRARRIFTMNASGVLRSHRVKSASGQDN
jgi:hypothetical protein